MADISKITTLDGTEYNIKDATARSLISNLPANNLQNLVDGSIPGSVRGTYTTPESENYTIGYYAFAEGMATKASGIAAHAEGRNNAATGDYSHVEGRVSTASGDYSHAEGHGTTASGEASHAEGNLTIANHQSQHVFGEYNIADDSTSAATSKGTYVEIVGNGISVSARSNARTLDWDGNEVLAGTLSVAKSFQISRSDSNRSAASEIYLIRGNVEAGTAPSDLGGNATLGKLVFADKNKTAMAYINHLYTTGKSSQLHIGIVNPMAPEGSTDNKLVLSVSNSGTPSVTLTSPDAWLSALGLLNTTYTSTISGILSPFSDISVTAAHFATFGKVAQLRVVFLKSTAVTSGNTNIATLTPGKAPVFHALATCHTNHDLVAYVNSNGNIVVNGPIAAGTSYTIYSTYILA